MLRAGRRATAPATPQGGPSLLPLSAPHTLTHARTLHSTPQVLFTPTARLEFRVTEFSWSDTPHF